MFLSFDEITLKLFRQILPSNKQYVESYKADKILPLTVSLKKLIQILIYAIYNAITYFLNQY